MGLLLTRDGVMSRLGGYRRGSAGLFESPFEAAMLGYAFNLLVSVDWAGHAHRVALSSLAKSVLWPRRARGRGGARRASSADVILSFEKRLAGLVRRRGRQPCSPSEPASPAGENLHTIARVVGLSDGERRILQLALALREPKMKDFVDPLSCDTPRAMALLLSTLAAIPVAEVEEALQPRSRLLATGILSIEDRGDLDDRLAVDARFHRLLGVPGLDAAAMMDRFLPAAPPPTLDGSDFDHLVDEVGLARRILRAAIDARQPGVNILFHGPTGTGKSELARRLAADVGVPLLVAGREDDKGKAPTAEQRLTSLLMGNRLVGARQGLLLFDEMEDLFTRNAIARMLGGGDGRDEARMSKQWFGAMLETNAVPTIWISNSIRFVDPAFLRRFAYIIRLGDFTAGQRRRAWMKHLGGDEVLPRAEIEALTERYRVSPAHIGSAVKVARLVGEQAPRRGTLEALLDPAEKLTHGDRTRPPAFEPGRYVPDVVNTPADLERIALRLGAFRPGAGPGLSLCLYGPPGTGKSEYVKYIAHRTDRPLLVKRCSDLLSCWVGESEKNIARAFDEARRDGALLLFDEADSFLRDRRDAARSWEVTQVNEFLQQLEIFPGIVACTTNLYKNLDQASLRRFAFKIEFRFLRADQALKLFARTLVDLGAGECAPSAGADSIATPAKPDAQPTPKTDAAPVPGGEALVPDTVARDLARITNLAPGDFAAARRRLCALGEPVTARLLLAELRAEAEAKEGAPRAVGFA